MSLLNHPIKYPVKVETTPYPIEHHIIKFPPCLDEIYKLYSVGIAKSKGNIEEKHTPNTTALKMQANYCLSTQSSKTVRKESKTNNQLRSSSFLMDFIFTQADTNLKIVIDIQNIELYFVACYLVAIPYKTAYEAIQLP